MMTNTLRSWFFPAFLILAGLCSPIDAQPIPLVVEGDSVPGVGLVTSISNIAVNSSGDWLVEADTDAGTDVDAVVIRNGSLYLREGDPLAFPSGVAIGGFDSITLNDAGKSAFNFILDNTPDNSGVFAGYDQPNPPVIVIQEGEPDPGDPLTPLVGFFDVKPSGPDTMLVIGTIDDPAITTSVDRGLYLWTLEPTTGEILASVRFAAEGDVLPGETSPVTDFGTSPHESAINDSGMVAFAADNDDGDTIYTFSAGAFSLLAKEGNPSPLPGRNWGALTSIALDVNNSGQVVFRADLDGDENTDKVIVLNGAILRQEGDAPPGFPSFSITSFGTGPVHVDDMGRVLWYADWDDPNTDIDTGLFLDDTLLVQEGDVIPGVGTIDTLRGVEDGYHFSADGRYVIFEAVLQGNIDAAFLIDLRGGAGAVFRRGDANDDGGVDIGDAIFTLAALFVVGSPASACNDAADANDDGANDIGDAVYTLGFLFTPGAPPPPSPGPIDCGEDPTGDGLDCLSTLFCP
ncbi:MAG: choice-of-anchor tandem repeat NxxGxxAF-containing protein [Planctomycetota bacterium]